MWVHVVRSGTKHTAFLVNNLKQSGRELAIKRHLILARRLPENLVNSVNVMFSENTYDSTVWTFDSEEIDTLIPMPIAGTVTTVAVINIYMEGG